jgi:hypothetical protein
VGFTLPPFSHHEKHEGHEGYEIHNFGFLVLRDIRSDFRVRLLTGWLMGDGSYNPRFSSGFGG